MKKSSQFPLLIQLFIFLLLWNSNTSMAQLAINTDGSNPNSSAMLDIKSSSKGILIPRMSETERANIINPANGLMVFDTTHNSFWFFNGSLWMEVGKDGLGNHEASTSLYLNGQHLYFRGISDTKNGLRWFGSGSTFSGMNINGPVLFGDEMGALGTANVSEATALRWLTDRRVLIGDINSINQSAFQDSSNQTNKGFLLSPWLYTNAIEARTEGGSSSTLITIGRDGYFGENDEIHLVTNGEDRLEINDIGEVFIKELAGTGKQRLFVDSNGKLISSPVSKGVYNVSPSDFSANLSTNTLLKNFVQGEKGAFLRSGSGIIAAPVHLPQGAIINKVTYWCTDSLSVGGLTITLSRASIAGSTQRGILSSFTSPSAPIGLGGGSYTEVDGTINAPNIDNSQYVYWIECKPEIVNWDSNGRLAINGIAIEYEMP
ncbi:MAG: hypothetical protein MRZ79_16970 [Bacteroidia bacterium]|nr:hypothetical protein [Bacteroidia bacterium]